MTLTERIKRDTKKAIQDYNTDKISFQTAISRLHDLGWALFFREPYGRL